MKNYSNSWSHNFANIPTSLSAVPKVYENVTPLIRPSYRIQSENCLSEQILCNYKFTDSEIKLYAYVISQIDNILARHHKRWVTYTEVSFENEVFTNIFWLWRESELSSYA